MDKITRQEALKLRLESNGKFFTAQYVKRTNGKDRTITGRIGVSKHFKTPDGSGSRYRPSQYELVRVWESPSRANPNGGYRSIDLRTLHTLSINGSKYSVV